MKIAKNIPIPKLEGKGRNLKYPWPDMEVGDSILIDYKGATGAAVAWAKRQGNGHKFAYRPAGEKFRVWRVA